MSQFDELLAQLNAEQEEQSTLAKALPAGDGDDQAIQAAATEGAEDNTNPEDAEGGEGGDQLAKSMANVEGEEVEVVEVGDLIKSLHEVTGRVTEVEGVLAKGLEVAVGMIKTQGEMIKSLQGQIQKLGSQGAGRKTVLAVHEKPAVETPLAKSQQEEFTKETLMAKSEAAWNAGVISGVEFSAVDVALRTGNKLDPGLINRIVNHK